MQVGRNQLADCCNSPGKEVRISASRVNGGDRTEEIFSRNVQEI